MKNSHQFFSNKECKYYPCHKDMEELNCLFCYCPFYTRQDCPGSPEFIISKKTGKTIKNCSACTFPHIPENYDKIIEYLKN